MKSLEDELGAPLFVRGKQGVELTQAGLILLRYLREEGRLWNACVDDIREVVETAPEFVRIGLLSMYVGYDRKRALLAEFQEDPDIRIDIADGDHDAFWRAMVAGNLDFAFTIRPPDTFGLPAILLRTGELSILMSTDNPLACKPFVDFETDMRGMTVIQTSPYKGRLYETAFKNYGIKVEMIVHDKNLMLAHVSTSYVCFIIQTEYARNLVTEQVCMRRLINAPIEMDSMFVFRPDLSPTARLVARKLLEPYEKEGELDTYFEKSKR